MQENSWTEIEFLIMLKGAYFQVRNAGTAIFDGRVIRMTTGLASRKMQTLNALRLLQPMTFLVVVLHDRTADSTIDCLHSLLDEIRVFPVSKVVVVDHASDDGSVAKIAAAISTNNWHKWVELLPLELSDGLTPGSRTAIHSVLKLAASCPYVLLLKPGSVVRPGALQALLDLMAEPSAVKTVSRRLGNVLLQQSVVRLARVVSELDLSLRLGVMSKLLLQWAGLSPLTDCSNQAQRFAGADMIMMAFDRMNYKVLVMRHGRVARYTLPVVKEVCT